MKVANNITELIGNTPIIRLNKLVGVQDAAVYVKLEAMNPGSSIKDRIALNMIEAAEKEGKLTKDSVIVEPTSGNTGIGLAMIGQPKGIRLFGDAGNNGIEEAFKHLVRIWCLRMALGMKVLLKPMR